MSAKRHQVTIGGTTAWAGPWEPWGRATRCRVYTKSGDCCAARVVGAKLDEVSTDGPTAQPVAVARVYAIVVMEAIRIAQGEPMEAVTAEDCYGFPGAPVDAQGVLFGEGVDRG